MQADRQTGRQRQRGREAERQRGRKAYYGTVARTALPTLLEDARAHHKVKKRNCEGSERPRGVWAGGRGVAAQ